MCARAYFHQQPWTGDRSVIGIVCERSLMHALSHVNLRARSLGSNNLTISDRISGLAITALTELRNVSVWK